MAALDVLSFLGVLMFASIHIFIGRFRFLDSPHTSWHSFAGGLAVSYVFVYTLPKLAKMQVILLSSKDSGLYGFMEHHAYLVALTGFIVYYAADRAVFSQQLSCPQQTRINGSGLVGYVNEFLHLAYLILIGYYIAGIPDGMILAMVVSMLLLHLLSLVHDKRHGNERIYDDLLRWLGAASLIIGWAIGTLTTISKTTEALWFAFLSGSILIHAIEGELPAKHHHRLGPFLLGAAMFAGVIVFIRWYLSE